MADSDLCTNLTPAAAITFAGGYTSYQPIILTTQYGCNGEYSLEEVKDNPISVKPEWAIHALDITLMRDWSTSEARISITANALDPSGKLPPLPDLSIFRGGNRKSIGPEDEIRIYLGYIPSNTFIDESMIDEYPYNFTNLDQEVLISSKPLKPVFWGFIDKVDHVGSATSGSRIVFSCRDRTRIFADTRIISIPSLQGSLDENKPTSAFAKGDRSQILLDLANSVSNTLGETQGTEDSWKPILPGLCFTGTSIVGGVATRKLPPEDPQAWINTACLSIMDGKARPRFHRWVERPPLTKGSESAIIQVEDKTPIEIFDYLSKHEESPMDFYSSHVNGDFVFGPRILDFSGFEDPQRNYRTYFYKAFPDLKEGQLPSDPQKIIDIRAVSSTLATFNKFVIVDDAVNGTSQSYLQNIRTGSYVLPWSLKNRKSPSGEFLSPPPRAQIIHDGALDTYENPQFGSIMVGLAASRIMARDIDNVQITILGDPTLCPGEAIRIYNTVIHDDTSYITADNKKADACLTDIKSSLYNEYKGKEDKDEGLANANPTSSFKSSQALDKALNENAGRLPTNSDLAQLVLPTYKTRSVQHSLKTTGSKAGYISLVSAVSDF